MKRFVFRLEKIRRLVSRAEKAKRIQFAKAQADHELLLQKRIRLEGARMEAEAEMARMGSQSEIWKTYWVRLGANLRSLHLQIRRSEAIVAEIETEWLETFREKKGLDRLRELRQEAWKDEQAKMEQNQIEELASLSRGRSPFKGDDSLVKEGKKA
jgi:flagellar export protein FliJ